MFNGTSGCNTQISLNSLTSRGREDSLASAQRRMFALKDLHIEMKNAGLLDPARNPLPVKARARLVIQGQYCPENARS